MTTLNSGISIEHTLESLQNFERKFQLVVVDARSTDDTCQKLHEWERNGGDLKLISEEGCNLGEGRQLALENADHDHVLVEIEADIAYEEVSNVLTRYETLQQEEPGKALLTTGNDGFLIAPKELLVRVGYRPLHWREDQSLHDRLYKRGDLRVLTTSVRTRQSPKGPHWVMTEAKMPNGDCIKTHEHNPPHGPLDRFHDWTNDSRCLYRIGFSYPQVLKHCILTLGGPRGVVAAVASTVARLTIGGDRWNDAVATSYTEIKNPKRHEYYSNDVLLTSRQ